MTTILKPSTDFLTSNKLLKVTDLMVVDRQLYNAKHMTMLDFIHLCVVAWENSSNDEIMSSNDKLQVFLN